MPSILYVIDTLAAGGAEYSVLEIARRLRSFEPCVCSLYSGEDLLDAYLSAGIEVQAMQLPHKYSYLVPVGLRRMIRERRPDLIHTTLYRATIATRLSVAGERGALVHSWVGEPIAHQRGSTRRLRVVAARALERRTSFLVDRFVANSRAIAEARCKALRIDPGRVTVIYRGRDSRRFRDVATTAATRRQLGLDHSQRLLLNVARLRPSKGQRVLVEALARVAERLPEAVLAIAGEGPYRSELERTTRDLGLVDRVRMLGFRTDVPELLAAASVFVFPSEREGLPGALIEAMHAGLPIVASDIPVHREVVEHGVSGLLVPVEDPDGLAEAIVRLVRDDRLARELGERAAERASRLFTSERMAAEHEDLYRGVLDDRARTALR